MDQIRIEPLAAPFDRTFAPPGSKSLTNRALVLAALAQGQTTLTGALFADDTRVMLDGLARLGFDVTADEAARTVRITGAAGQVPATGAELFCGNSGTTLRFLTALCSLGRGTYTLDGVPRMRQRPVGPLVTMLRNLGCRIAHTAADGFPPVRLQADRLPGGIVGYGSETSSQYLSAVLHVAPYARNEVQIDLAGRQTSWPYVAMTMRLMDDFGCWCELERDPATAEPRRIIVPPGRYAGGRHAIEPDASNASYFLALAALHPGSRVTIPGLGRLSLQGDVGFADVLGQMGAKVTFTRASNRVGERSDARPDARAGEGPDPRAGAPAGTAPAGTAPAGRAGEAGGELSGGFPGNSSSAGGWSPGGGDFRGAAAGEQHGGSDANRAGQSVESITVEGTDVLEGIDVDLSPMPDVAQTLAVVALFAARPTTIRGLATLRVKETDRLAALQTELTKLGAEVAIDDAGGDVALHITPPDRPRQAELDTYDDHRMAMSLALAGSRTPGIRINDPACVNKTYPNYFKDLASFGVTSG